jgi:hypothetical protein
MARNDDGPKDAKASAGAKKKRAAPRKAETPTRKAASAPKAPPAAKRAPARAASPVKPAAAKPAAKPKAPAARKTAARAAAPMAPAPRAPRRKAAAATPRVSAPLPPPADLPEAAVTEEERIESAKYLPRERPARAFEEDRFLFPETYGENRVRLLVKDPQWLFAHWDVSPESLTELRREVGERTAALSRLTLRIQDPQHGGRSVILLPEGVRTWYVKADDTPRAYRAELGITLPSGEFRKLAESNTVRTPWVGPSGERAERRVRFDGTPLQRPMGLRPGAAAAAAAADPLPAPARVAEPGPWTPEPPTHVGHETGAPPSESKPAGGASPGLGGASDVYRR